MSPYAKSTAPAWRREPTQPPSRHPDSPRIIPCLRTAPHAIIPPLRNTFSNTSIGTTQCPSLVRYLRVQVVRVWTRYIRIVRRATTSPEGNADWYQRWRCGDDILGRSSCLHQVTGLQISWMAMADIIIDEEDVVGDKVNWR